MAAKRIFRKLIRSDSRAIYLEDLMQFLIDDNALKTPRLIHSEDQTQGINKRAIKNWVVNAFRERKALALSLNNAKTAVHNLHRLLNLVVGILVIVIWLLIFKLATTQLLVFLCSQILLTGFMFGNTCKATFEAIIFVFVVHPFDVVIAAKLTMTVEEMNLLTTVLLRYDNQKIIYPNVLVAKPIASYYRSLDMSDIINFGVFISTSLEMMASMKVHIISYINNSSLWHPRLIVAVNPLEDGTRIKMSVHLSHRINFQDMGERW